MACKACHIVTRVGNDAVDQRFDNFQRFYGRYLTSEDKPIPGHKYQHEGLKDRNHTRLLELLPGNDEEGIVCRLAEAPIDNPPRYAALSYTWGTAARTKMVLVNNQEFLVTDNLWTALWHLRLPDKTRILWVDAICIDQSRTEELKGTIPRMKDIYESAKEIIAWLGPQINYGMLALSCIEKIFSYYQELVKLLGSHDSAFQNMLVQRSWMGENEKGGSVEPKKQVLGEISPKSAWLAIETLFKQRTWFRGVWIMQEGTVPIQTTFYVCHQRLQADALFLVFSLLDSIPQNEFPNNIVQTIFTPYIRDLTTFARKRHDLWLSDKKANFPLIDVLSMFRNHSASDPHDKIYSALGFATDMKLPIEVDYKKPFSEMLRDVAVSCVHEDSYNLRFLGHASLLGTGHMPATWIPDWLHSKLPTPFPKLAYGSGSGNVLFDACAVNHRVWKQPACIGLQPLVEGNTLKAHGILVDYVRSTSVSSGHPKDIHCLEDIWYLGDANKPYLATGETLEEAYLRSLVADLKMKDGKVIGRGGSMYWRNRPDSPSPPDHSDILQLLQQVCVFRRFITTLEHGYVGIAPAYTEPGDAIFMLKGGEVLYIARPTLVGTYHFVGEAYVHGKMDGQVLQDFENGQGVMQLIELEPVLNEVLDSTKSTSLENPVNVKYMQKGYGVQGIEFSNPYEHMEPYNHSEVGPRMDVIIAEAKAGIMTAYIQAGITEEQVIRKTDIEQLWADAIVDILLSDEEVLPESSSGVKLAGREFARRSYILAGLALERERIRMQYLAHFQGLVNLGRGLETLHVTTYENQMESEDPIDKERQKGKEKATTQKFGEKSSKIKNIFRNTKSLIIKSKPESKKPSKLGEPSGTNRFPLLNRRTGPPVRLMISETKGPCNQVYSFQSTEDFEEFENELSKYGPISERENARPLLMGRWATDPKKRPKVSLYSYGQVPKIWWEDEEGNVVKGPEMDMEIEDKNS